MITWLASYPKSGNTYVRLLLNAYWCNGHVDINNLPYGGSDVRPYYYRNVCPAEDYTDEEVYLMRPAALWHMSVGMHQKPTLLKTHMVVGDYAGIPLIPPSLTERAFYMIRDPRDVAISYARHMDVSIDEAIHQMSEEHCRIGGEKNLYHILSTWSQHVLSWTRQSDFPAHVVKYERLIEQPADVLANILDRLGMDFDTDRIQTAVDAVTMAKCRAQEKKNGFAEKPANMGEFFSGETNWRETLTAEQADRIVNDHGATMEAFGYDTAAR